MATTLSIISRYGTIAVNNKKEKLKLNEDCLKVATFWHDVVFENPSKKSIDDVRYVCKYLQSYLSSLKFTKEEVKKAIKAVRYHEFGDEPRTIEGFVLQDEDKLDVLSVERWRRTYLAYKQGVLSKEILSSYFKTGLTWIPLLEDSIHFKSSKNIVRKEIKHIFKTEMFDKYVKEFGAEKECKEMLRNLRV